MKIPKMLIFAVIAGAFVLRVLPIGWGLPSTNLALSSYSCDEQNSFYALEHMNPRKFNFYPGVVLAWGGAHINLLGITEKAAELLGVVKFGTREYYQKNLKELDKLYMVGRLIPIIAGTISVWLFYLVILGFFQNSAAALLGGFILAIIPLHMAYSFYIRPDALMIMLALCTMLFSIKILETGTRKAYVLCGMFSGLMISAKYSGGAFIVFPLLSHVLYSYKTRQPLFGKIQGRNLLLAVLAALAAFVITCPYSLTPEFLYWVNGMINQAKGSPYQQIGRLMPLTYLLPAGIGWPLVLSGVAGFVGLAVSLLRDRDQKKILLVLAGPAMYWMISSIKSPMAIYALPLVPLLVIYAVYCLKTLWDLKNKAAGYVGRLLVVFVLVYAAAYSMSYLNLFLVKNVREEASEWIVKNIPRGATVAIVKNFFWTPPVLKQYEPPYKLLTGGAPNISDALLGLEKACEKADYLVLSEFEYRDYVDTPVEKFYPEQSRIIRNIFSGKNFEKAAEFYSEPHFLGFTFKQDFPPADMLFPNPRIFIFKIKHPAGPVRAARAG
jgi:hypothetical protein